MKTKFASRKLFYVKHKWNMVFYKCKVKKDNVLLLLKLDYGE